MQKAPRPARNVQHASCLCRDSAVRPSHRFASIYAHLVANPVFGWIDPDCRQPPSIIVEAMGGSGDNDYEKEEKIIKNIAKNIMVEK